VITYTDSSAKSESEAARPTSAAPFTSFVWQMKATAGEAANHMPEIDESIFRLQTSDFRLQTSDTYTNYQIYKKF
jgi:hypothetical protein